MKLFLESVTDEAPVARLHQSEQNFANWLRLARSEVSLRLALRCEPVALNLHRIRFKPLFSMRILYFGADKWVLALV